MTKAAMGAAQPLLRELIKIPERLHRGDFVLRLTEGVAHRKATVDSYVVTPELSVAFDEALALVGAALAENSSKASYVHGSFGSGKSHFMAVLHAVLDRDVDALDKADLVRVIGRHEWLSHKRLMLVPYHLTGSPTLEAGILGGYVEYIRREHPTARLPQVYRAQGLLRDARRLRDQFGAEAFLARLTSAAPASDTGWGELDTGWTLQLLDEAFDADPDSALARRLLGEVVPVFMPDYADTVAGAADAFRPIDQGLVEISRHAKELGYDGLVLFLDELVLWLAGRIGNREFIARETDKVAKLVESADSARPIPIISLIARQRDLRELGVGAERTGAELQAFHDRLKHWDDRLGTITLEDRNLPLIAQRRVLEPRGERERATIEQAFQRTSALAGGVRDVLLGQSDHGAFEQTYPFSPAFMDTLVKASNALQRERTALLLMQQILVNRRDEFRLGDLVPLGDLFDAIADGGDQPFTDKLKHEFDQARRLYQRTLRPMLLRDRDLTEEQVAGTVPAEAGRLVAFRGDDRLVKTLLLAALIPDVSALQNLTARRLAALNHGSVKTPIPGQEIGEVARRLRRWAGQVAELQVGEGADPTARLELVGVNVDAIIESVVRFDNAGARRRLVRELLFDQLGITDADTTPIDHVVPWRGSRRVIEIVYGNVRDTQELRDNEFEPLHTGRWRLILDYPFDPDELSAAADRNRVRSLRTTLNKPWTVTWLPAFFTGDVIDRISRLVRVNHLLTRNNLDEAASRYNAADRQRVRDLLGNLRVSLRNEIVEALKNAYGLVARPKEDLVQDWHDHLVSLDPGITPKLDAGRSFVDALAGLVDQLYSHTYPDHPHLDSHNKGDLMRPADLKTTLAVVRRAADAVDGRIDLDRAEREAIRRIAHPLHLGQDHGGPFTLDHEVGQELDQLAAKDNLADKDIMVRTVRAWLAPRGMETKVENLLIAAYAELTRRTWLRGDEVITPPAAVEDVTDALALRRAPMPSDEQWARAEDLAGGLFGVSPTSGVVSPRSVARFADAVMTRAEPLRQPAIELVEVLDTHGGRLGLDTSAPTGRYVTATVASGLLADLRAAAGPTELVEVLATADLRDIEPLLLSKSMKSASEVVGALRNADWAVLDRLDDTRADRVRETVRRNVNANEQAASLARTLDDAKRELLRVFLPPQEPESDDRPQRPDPPAPSTSARRTARGRMDTVLAAVRQFAEQHPGVQYEIEIRTVEPGEGES
ncbi:hypothetical protein [Kibdelosporangium aridum]|nr:hypothetical protein [Kibdelosporangium aridum]